MGRFGHTWGPTLLIPLAPLRAGRDPPITQSGLNVHPWHIKNGHINALRPHKYMGSPQRVEGPSLPSDCRRSPGPHPLPLFRTLFRPPYPPPTSLNIQDIDDGDASVDGPRPASYSQGPSAAVPPLQLLRPAVPLGGGDSSVTAAGQRPQLALHASPAAAVYASADLVLSPRPPPQPPQQLLGAAAHETPVGHSSGRSQPVRVRVSVWGRNCIY